MKQSFALLVMVAMASLLFSCGTDSGRASTSNDSARERSASSSDSSGGGSGLWDMLARSEEEKARRQPLQRERENRLRTQNAKGMAALPADQRENMIRWWQEFIELKPSWVQSRHLWRAYGNDAKEILAENLIIAMVRAYSKNNGPIYKRARSELFDLADVATPYLVAGLADGRGDSVTRTHCVEMLGLYGAKAVPAISSAYSDAGRDARLDLLRAIKAMGPLGAPQSVSFLTRSLRREKDYRLRLTAIQGLGASEDPRSIPALIDCLQDDDVSVRKFSAGTLGHFRSDEATLALIEALENSEKRRMPGNRENEVVANCIHSLRSITGESYRHGAHWRRWWNRR